MTEKKYIEYIVDIKNRKIIGDFEKAYAKCNDIWPTQFLVDTPKHIITEDILLKNKEENKVLDIGCGFGAYVNHLSKLGLNTHGCDISQTAIKKSEELFKTKLNLKLGNILDGLPYKNNEFDSTICFGVLQYMLNHIDSCVNELLRVTKNNGNIFISLSMNGNSIGSESLSGYNDFIKICSNKFYLNGAIEILKNEDINSNYHKDKIRSDFFLWGIKK